MTKKVFVSDPDPRFVGTSLEGVISLSADKAFKAWTRYNEPDPRFVGTSLEGVISLSAQKAFQDWVHGRYTP